MFNAGRYFDAHEPWEEIWRSTSPEPRDLFQGLVQVTAGLYHWHERGKAGPAARLLARGVARLTAFRPSRCGLDVEHLLHALTPWSRFFSHTSAPPPDPPSIRFRSGGL